MNASAIRLEITGLGNCISFKNTKSIFRRKNGQRFIATNPKYKKWMEQVTQSFVSQLHLISRTTEGEILTDAQRLFWTASSIPADDSWQWIPELKATATMVPKGHEGVSILIERI